MLLSQGQFVRGRDGFLGEKSYFLVKAFFQKSLSLVSLFQNWSLLTKAPTAILRTSVFKVGVEVISSFEGIYNE